MIDTFKYFIGNWHVERMVGKIGHASGTANFLLLDTNYIKYCENLKLQLVDSSSFQHVYKEYIYKYEDGKITKNFTDDKLFYELEFDPIKSQAYGSYLCEKDQYQATYNFRDESHFTLIYEVHGPEKNYILQSEFTRIN